MTSVLSKCLFQVNTIVNSHWLTEISNLNFQSLEGVSRYRDPQLQVIENLCDLRNSSPNNLSVSRLNAYFTVNS